MRFNFDWSDNEEEIPPPCPSFPNVEVEWLPLQKHPLFTAAKVTSEVGDSGKVSASRARKNHLTWDGGSRMYFWHSKQRYLHCITLRFGDPEPGLILAASPSKILQADKELNFAVNEVSLNRTGSVALLTGSRVIYVMYLFGRSSSKHKAGVCRTVSVGSSIFTESNNALCILQAMWHPDSDTHVGILSSDSVFRLYDFSANLEEPEQEYYLQPVESGRSWNAASLCPKAFSFGYNHLWNSFSVFFLFADGSIYILCPVVPFGSVHRWESILEIYNDAHVFGKKSSNSRAITSSSLAISWLEATFPALSNCDTEVDILHVNACSYTLHDASLLLQGPLQDLCRDSKNYAEMPKCEGPAVSFFHSAVSKDSIFATVWGEGQLQIDALAEEIQPLWKFGSQPRLRVDLCDEILGFAMICEFNPSEISDVNVDPNQTAWLGKSPHLLRLALVDLNLNKTAEQGFLTYIYGDSLVPEKLYCVHNHGIDSIILHSLPFTSLASGKGNTMRSPSVNPMLTICHGEVPVVSALSGFAQVSDSFGCSWVVAVTSALECIVLETKMWDVCLSLHANMKQNFTPDEADEADMSCFINEGILSGPQLLLIPSDSKLHSTSADSIDGRGALHKFSNLFHENYMKYAYKVYFELKNHASHMENITSEQLSRLNEAQQTLANVSTKQQGLDNRLMRAEEKHRLLNLRLQNLTSHPVARRNPLSKTERQFKCQLDTFKVVELEAMRTFIEAFSGRLSRYRESITSNLDRQLPRRTSRHITDSPHDLQMSKLKSSMQKLSLLSRENAEKVKFLESTLESRECRSR